VKVIDVMSTNVVTANPEMGLKEAARTMINAGISGLPVVDDEGKIVGIITEADFVEAEADRSWGRRRRLLDALFGEQEPRTASTVGDAMSRNPVCVDQGSDLTEAARKMTEQGIKRLPVVNPDGLLEGIISRADVMSAFARPDEVIADEIEQDVVRRIMLLDPKDIEIEVTDGVVAIGGRVPNKSDARLLEELICRLDGVVRCESDLAWEYDDTRSPMPPPP
jgi:CBS domain-containing protein